MKRFEAELAKFEPVYLATCHEHFLASANLEQAYKEVYDSGLSPKKVF